MNVYRSTIAIIVSLSITKSCQGLSSTTLTSGTSSTILKSPASVLADFDYTSPSASKRIPWREDGYGTWQWRDQNVNYIELGDPTKPALLLVHGFGASAYHFRNNIPDLAKDYHVFAPDMLGFGLSDKPLIEYNAELWKEQALDFVREVIGKPTTVAGNSIGGFTALYAAADKGAKEEKLIDACILLNAAGSFRNPEMEVATDDKESEDDKNAIVESIKTAVSKFVINVSFVITKQPLRIQQILRQVYPVSPDYVDDELVRSIQLPAENPNAAEVFYRIITRTAGRPSVYVDDLLADMNGEMPLLLCWGESDPWIRPAAADRIQALYPSAVRVSIDAGHCPHDESPDAVNDAIRNFMEDVSAKKKMSAGGQLDGWFSKIVQQ